MDRNPLRPLTQVAKSVGNLDLSPPQWIVQLASAQDRTVPWRDMVRAALSVGVPLGVGYATGNLALSLLVAIGTLPGMFADRGGPLGDRYKRGVLGLLGAVSGLLLGHVFVGAGPSAILAVAVLSLFAGLISPISAATSFASLQLLVYIAIGSGFVVPLPLYEFPLLLLAGGAWAMTLSTVQVLIEGMSSPQRDAVVAVYTAIADLLRASGSDEAAEARQKLTTALNGAYDVVVGARSRSHGRDSHLRWLGNMLSAAMGVAEAAVAVAHASLPPPQKEIDAISALASAIESGGSPPASIAHPANEPLQLRALRHAIAHASKQLRHEPEGGTERGSLHQRVSHAVEATVDTIAARGNWMYALRVTLCMTAAEAVREVVPIDRPYWILLTVAIVVKPDMGSVFARAIQRGAGTIVGVFLGAALLAFVPMGPPILVSVTTLAALLPLAMRRNYGLLAIFITPLALMLIDLAIGGGGSILLARLEATVIGCAIVLVLGYLFWPETWRSRVSSRVAESIASITTYLDAAFGSDEAERTARRRAVYRGLSEVRTELQRMLSEPPPFNRQAAAWWPVVQGLERITDAITEASVSVRQGASYPSPHDQKILTESLDHLSVALRDGRSPSPMPEISDPVLSGVGDEIAGLRNLVDREPRLYLLPRRVET